MVKSVFFLIPSSSQIGLQPKQVRRIDQKNKGDPDRACHGHADHMAHGRSGQKTPLFGHLRGSPIIQARDLGLMTLFWMARDQQRQHQ